MNKKLYKDPVNDNRIYRLVHSIPEEYETYIDNNIAEGFGGFVINASWHTDKNESDKKYLCEPEDFTNLEERIDIIKNKNCGLWLYDEKGYPSASADGLTLENHPEYEARGFTCIEVNDVDFVLSEEFEKIIFACKKDGTPVDFTEKNATGADVCYAVKPVYEGSHAEKCGWGPRRYPNLMDKDAIAAFISCTYDRYFENVKNFDQFEAVFTDEPSLMSAYVNCGVRMTYAFLPWQDKLPEKFSEMHGIDFYSVITELFDMSDTFKKEKLMYWETVSEMVNEAYFVQIRDWCREHNIIFSGHCLLEECISMHAPLYGNLIKCLKSFDYPGVDMLTGSPVAFKTDKNMQFAMAAKYVGSTARMTGNTKKVMVEICPLAGWNNSKEFTLEEEIGTMDLLFMCGINHINSYLAPERLAGKFKVYADYFARASYVLRDSVWNGKIGMYYPIENMQGYYHPEFFGVNNGAPITATETRIQTSMFELYNKINAAKLDYTIIDAEWINAAEIVNGALVLNDLEITSIVMPSVNYVPDKVLEKLALFEKAGGKVVWEETIPDGVDGKVSANTIADLKSSVDYGISIECEDQESIYVSPVIKNGKRIWYVINSTGKENTLSISLGDTAFEIWNNMDGSVSDEKQVTLMPYTSVFVCEK